VSVIVLRDGIQQNVTVTLGLLPDRSASRVVPASIKRASVNRETQFGASLATTPEGVVVAALEPNGPARKGGLESGDVILEVSNRVISQPQDLADALNASREEAVLVLVRRGGAELYVGVSLRDS